MAYLLDTNCFINAKNREYGFDFCPAYWDWILREHVAGNVFSIERVRDELLVGNDDLSTWTANLPGTFFQSPDADVLPSLTVLSSWASGGGFDPAAVTNFLNVADFFLVGQALAFGHTIVTHEVISASIKKIKIPNACVQFGVRYINPYQMLRNEQARFVLV